MSLTDIERKAHFGSNIFLDELGDYDTNGLLIYQGFAQIGTSQSASKWLIQRHAYDGSSRWVSTTIKIGAWVNRTTLLP